MTNTENLSINRSRCSRSRCFPPSVLLYSCLVEIHVCASLFLLICITYAPLYKAQSLLLSVQKRTLLELSSCSSAFSREQRQLLTAAPCVPADHLQTGCCTPPPTVITTRYLETWCVCLWTSMCHFVEFLHKYGLCGLSDTFHSSYQIFGSHNMKNFMDTGLMLGWS